MSIPITIRKKMKHITTQLEASGSFFNNMKTES